MLKDIISNCLAAAIVGLFGVAIMKKGKEEGKSPIKYKDVIILLLVLLFVGAVFGWVISEDPNGSLWSEGLAKIEPHINLLMKFSFLTSVLGGVLPTGLLIAYVILRLINVPKDIWHKTGRIIYESAFWVLVGTLISIFFLELDCAAVGDFSPVSELIDGDVNMRSFICALSVYLQASLAPAAISVYTGLLVDGVRTLPQDWKDFRNGICALWKKHRNSRLKKQGKHYKQF